MIGVMYIGDCCNVYAGYDYVVSNASDPYFANTGLTNGSRLTKLVGYEWDAIINNGFSPPGVVALSASPVTAASIAEGQPSNPSQIAHSARYTAASGAKVFATGSIQWVWGLDAGYFVSPARVDTRAKQIAVNVLASMGARPINPSAGIVVP
jgi:hypothetical protein